MILTILSLVLLLGLALSMVAGLLNVLKAWVDGEAAAAPSFGDAGCEQSAECGEPKSQFAWRSRAHF